MLGENGKYDYTLFRTEKKQVVLLNFFSTHIEKIFRTMEQFSRYLNFLIPWEQINMIYSTFIRNKKQI